MWQHLAFSLCLAQTQIFSDLHTHATSQNDSCRLWERTLQCSAFACNPSFDEWTKTAASPFISQPLHFTRLTRKIREWHTEGLDKRADLPFAFAFFKPFSSPSNLIRHFPNQSSVQLHLAGAFGWRRTQALKASSLMGRVKHDRGEKHTSLVGLNTRSQRDSPRLNGISKAHQSLLPGIAPANTPKSNYDTIATSASP